VFLSTGILCRAPARGAPAAFWRVRSVSVEPGSVNRAAVAIFAPDQQCVGARVTADFSRFLLAADGLTEDRGLQSVTELLSSTVKQQRLHRGAARKRTAGGQTPVASTPKMLMIEARRSLCVRPRQHRRPIHDPE
jgi:hypothetical protein